MEIFISAMQGNDNKFAVFNFTLCCGEKKNLIGSLEVNLFRTSLQNKDLGFDNMKILGNISTRS